MLQESKRVHVNVRPVPQFQFEIRDNSVYMQMRHGYV